MGASGTAGTYLMYPASGNFTTTLGTAATASNTINFPATVPTTLDGMHCVTSSTTCTLTDNGYAYNSIPNADLANSAITIAGTSVSLGGSTSSLPSPGAIGGGTPAAITGTTITANTQLNLGASGTLAPLVMGNATSGTMTIQPVTGAISGTMLIPVPAGLTRFTQTIGEGTITVTGDAPTSGACAAEHTVSVTNLLTTDVVRVGFNGDPSGVTGIAPVSTGGVFIVAYPKAAGTLGLKVCNDTALTITVGTLILNWTVQR